jgi:hypothetical protein
VLHRLYIARVQHPKKMKEIMYFVIRDVPNVSIRHMRETGGKLAVRCDLKIFTSCDETKIRLLVLRRVCSLTCF